MLLSLLGIVVKPDSAASGNMTRSPSEYLGSTPGLQRYVLVNNNMSAASGQ